MAEEAEAVVEIKKNRPSVKIRLNEFLKRVKAFLESVDRAAKKADYFATTKIFLRAERTYKRVGFDLISALSELEGPIIEVAAPTKQGFWFGETLIDPKYLGREYASSDILPGIPVVDKKGRIIKYCSKVDFTADARALPFGNETVGSLFASCPPNEIRDKFFTEANRVLRLGGLLVLQGIWKKDLEKCQENGFIPEEIWANRPALEDGDGFYNVVLRKAGQPSE